MNLDRFSQPMPWEGRDPEAELERDEEIGEQKLERERNDPDEAPNSSDAMPSV